MQKRKKNVKKENKNKNVTKKKKKYKNVAFPFISTNINNFND